MIVEELLIITYRTAGSSTRCTLTNEIAVYEVTPPPRSRGQSPEILRSRYLPTLLLAHVLQQTTAEKVEF
jgi:hypothetical protein